MKHLLRAICAFAFFLSCHVTQASNNAAYEQRRAAYIATALSNFGPDAITLQAYMGVPVDTGALNALLNGISTGSTSDFDIVKLVRVLYFDSTYKNQILPVLLAVPYWINKGDNLRVYWSENHMCMWMSCDWLLHEKYGKPVDTNLRKRLVHFLQLKIQYGYYEFYSSVYSPYCLTGLLNLADFAQDAEIKDLATQAAQRLLKSILSFTNDQGVFFPPAGRNYPGKYESAYGQNHNNLIYLLTGFGEAPGGASHAGGFLASSTLPVDTIIDSWTPVLDTVEYIGHTIQQGLALNHNMSSVDSVIFGWSAGEYFHPLLALSTFNLLTDSNMWHHPDFSAFAALSIITPSSVVPTANALNVASESSVICNDTIAIYKHYSVTLGSVQDFWPGKLGYQQHPCVANIKNTAVYIASGEPLADWTQRNANEANDDLPYIKQVKNVALLMYRAQPKPPAIGVSVPTVELHWNNTDFTETREDSNWLLGRVDNSYVAVRRHCTDSINGVWACNVPNGQAWVIMVGDSATYGTFDQFKQVVDASQFVERWYYDTAAQQEDYYAQVVIDGHDINHVWAVDSTMPAGIENIMPSVFKVYPNPASTVVNIDLPNALENGMLEIYSTTGQLVYRAAVTGKSLNVPTLNLSDGMYALRILADGNSLGTQCFMVSH